ncbi:MAG TPA: hypothetical protein VMF09_12570 [Solirubrobacteraceae bacterium]|nr:hypothetical protein [Solirubrobacteraceae bacterium]
MRRSKRVAVCLAVVFGCSAVASESASALSPPEFGQCVKAAISGSGAYKGDKCTNPTGVLNFEWLPGAKEGSGMTSTTSVTFETVSNRKIRCAGEDGEDQYDGTKTVAAVMIFTGCQMSSAYTCTSTGYNAGDIVSNGSGGWLEGELGVEKVGAMLVNDKLALDFKPATGTEFLEPFTCTNGDSWNVRGELMVPVEKNKMQTTTHWAFDQMGGKQMPEKFASGGLHILEGSLNGGGWKQMGVKFTADDSVSEMIEANSAY